MVRNIVALALAGVALAERKKTPLKEFVIDLDLAPEERWTEVVTAHKTYIKLMMDALRLLFSGDAAQQLLNATVVDDEQRGEMQGIADALGVPYKDALMVNFFYELDEVADALPEEWRQVMARACTGIVAQSSNGTIYHARNMDYPPPFSAVQYIGTFMKGGEVLFKGTSFASITGMGGNCMVPGKWSAEINARSSYSPSLSQAIDHASKGWLGYPQLLRKGCESGGDFQAGLKFLSETPMIANGYITIAGAAPGEGAILTRNATGTDTDILELKDGHPSDEAWYIIETNYDHWTDAPAKDDRRDNGIRSMEAVGPDNVNLDTLWEVMSDTGAGSGTRGVYNQATVSTQLVIPATGEFHSYMGHNIIENEVVV